MPEIEGDHNSTLTVTVKPTLVAQWSRSRCWHGEKVTIAVRSSFVPDGTTVELKILTKDGLAEFVSIKDQKINGSKLDHSYTIDWKDNPPPDGKYEFVVQAITTDPAVTSPNSLPLAVDLVSPVHSF